ncbi:ABC transporter ATP-binding protein/permease [Myxococcota bacterium]|nr:ABC transporter ATP-binding protein/permease [Myxococcota bacterium]
MVQAGPPPPERGFFATARLAFAQTPRAVRLVLAADARSVAIIVVLSVVGSLFPLAAAYVAKLIVDAVLVAVESGAAADREHALWMVGAELALFTVMGAINFAVGVVRTNLGTKLAYFIQVRILEKALELDLSHFEDPRLYDKLQNARREASSRPLELFNNLVAILGNAVQLVSYGALLFAFSPWTLLILLAAAVPAFFLEAKFSGEAFRVFSWRAPEQRKMRYLESLMTNDTSAKEVKLYGLGPLLISRYRALYDALYREERSLVVRRSGWTFVLGLLSSLALYGCYVWIVVRTIDGTLTLGDMTLYVTVFRNGQAATRAILKSISTMYEDNLFISNLFGFLELPTTAPRTTTPAPADRPRTGFVLEDVSFRYSGPGGLALSNVSLTIGPEEKLAIVGENGAGKSTLIKLLTGLYRPTSGRITLDGVPLDEVDPAELHRRCGVVLQDFVRYQFTAKDNVGLGRWEHLDDQRAIEAAAERGGATPVVEKLPNGWATQLGRWFEGGVDLSAGNWQKLAMSRAFMRDADILVLDEPTAALDAEAEHALFERFKQLTAGRMALLVSHRFSTVRMADRIVVLSGGRIQELGTHDALMQANGRYAHLFRLQAAGYLDAAKPAKPRPE